MIFKCNSFYNFEKVFQNGLRKYLHSSSCRYESISRDAKDIFEGKKHKKDYSTPIKKIKSYPSNVPKQKVALGITNEEYSLRRFRLMNSICQNSSRPHHIVIMPGSTRNYMIDKIPYLFRQDTDMLYLSGCQEKDCVLVLHSLPQSDAPAHKVVMFTPPYDPGKELWDGPFTCAGSASAHWGVDEGLPVTDIMHYLECLEKDLGEPDIWYNFLSPPNPKLHQTIHKWVLKGRIGKLSSPKQFIHSLRVIKSPSEVELMRETCRISAEAISATMSVSTPSMCEHKLFATVDYECRMRGADHLAYPPVIAGGNRANIIHYINNNNLINPGELVLMDAGSEFKGYSGDITRTWPVDGNFSPAQQDLYEAVLEVQNHVISECANRRPTINELFVIMCDKLGSVLQEICLLPKDLTKEQRSQAAYGFCPHHVSHYLGMDVHDTPLASKNDKLSPGCVISVEPGVYVNSKKTSVPSRYLGMGVRIEDDILITETGIEVLSKDCPKHPDEIKEIVGSSAL